MTIVELQNKNLRHGVFHKASWKSEKVVNGVEYTKVSNGVVRIVKYRNIKQVKAKLSVKAPSSKQWLIEDLLSYNQNTGNYLVSLGTTHIKPSSKYYVNGKEVNKEEYEMVIKPNTNDSVIFSVKLENLISIE